MLEDTLSLCPYGQVPERFERPRVSTMDLEDGKNQLSDQTVGNILRRHGIAPAPSRSQTTSWKDFIAAHKDVLVGADFFTVEVSRRGLLTYYVLFFIHLEIRRVNVAGITRHPDQEWMDQIARNATQEKLGISEWKPLCPA